MQLTAACTRAGLLDRGRRKAVAPPKAGGLSEAIRCRSFVGVHPLRSIGFPAGLFVSIGSAFQIQVLATGAGRWILTPVH